MLVGLHTTWSAPQAKNPSYAPAHYNNKKFSSNFIITISLFYDLSRIVSDLG